MTLPTRALGTTGMAMTRVGFGAWAIGGAGWAFAGAVRTTTASVAAMRHAVESRRELDRHGRCLRAGTLGGGGRRRRFATIRRLTARSCSPSAAWCGTRTTGLGQPPADRCARLAPGARSSSHSAARRRPHRPLPDALAGGRRHPDPEVVRQTLLDLKQAGKVRATGLSNYKRGSARTGRRPLVGTSTLCSRRSLR